MAREFSRTDRVAQQLHKEIASIIQNEYKHRVGKSPLITVSDVEVSRDLAHAKVFFTFYVDEREIAVQQLKLLEEHKPMIRNLLSKRVRMRAVPHLHFFEDTSITEGVRISHLVSETVARDKQKEVKNADEKDHGEDA